MTRGDAPQDGHTPLFIAAREGHLEVAQILLDAGANKQAKVKVRGGREWAAMRVWGVFSARTVCLLFPDVMAGIVFVVNCATWRLDGNTGSRTLNVVLEQT